MVKSSTFVRLGSTLLMAAGVSLLAGNAAQAAGRDTVGTTATTSIIAPDGPVKLSFVRSGLVNGVDSAGRAISVVLQPTAPRTPVKLAVAYN